MNEKGKLIVISGPSGAGKSTVVFQAMEGRNDLCFSTSVTTRKPRPGEVDGREYFFVDLERFDEMIKNDELLEHAVYVANSYGTPRKYPLWMSWNAVLSDAAPIRPAPLRQD